MWRKGQDKVKARSNKSQGKVKVRSRQRKQNLNLNYNLMGFDTIEINLVRYLVSYIIPGEQYIHYTKGILELVNCESLKERGMKMSEKLVKNSAIH